MKGILWYVTRKLEGIFDGILMEFRMRILEDKNQIKKSMYIPRFLSSGLYGSKTEFGSHPNIRTTKTKGSFCILSPKFYHMFKGAWLKNQCNSTVPDSQ